MMLGCTDCKNTFQTVDANLVRMGTACPVCGRFQHFATALENFYGKTVGTEARRIMAQLERADSRKDATLTAAIARAEKELQYIINAVFLEKLAA